MNRTSLTTAHGSSWKTELRFPATPVCCRKRCAVQKKKHKKTYMSGKASDEEKAAPAYQTLVHFFIFTQQYSTVRITYALLYLPLSSAPSSKCSEYFEEKSEKTNNFFMWILH